MNGMSRRVEKVAVALAVPCLLIMAVSLSILLGGGEEAREPRLGGFPTRPIPGEEVSVIEAMNRAGIAVPGCLPLRSSITAQAPGRL